MKRKAFFNTLIDVLMCICGVIIIGVVVYLLVMIPIWITNYFDFLNKYGNDATLIMYGAEWLILVCGSSIIRFIRNCYHEHLEELKSEKEPTDKIC